MKIVILLIVLVAIPFLIKALRSLAGAGKYTNINGQAFAEHMQDKNAVVLDVRSPQEVAQGKIKGAQVINIMGADFSQKIKTLDKTKTYLVYCRSGNRSARACSLMAKEGFTNLYNLTGGYGAWLNRKN
ncbi:MAG: rhodanese-like domain-containing protein [Bacteroidetes bacterium]|nr:MAG: rhodanese-like domain-containing protein [Bacteroidota bacterium]PTM11009.1 MAG: rhodanese-like domain-containing protein [Bacteroidota bacterium]